MDISVVIPCYNEEKYIHTILRNILSEKQLSVEIFVVDAGSTDGTVSIVNNFIKKNDQIVLIHNKKKYVSYGFNETIPRCRGKYISIMGAHAIYPKHFLTEAFGILESGICDVVGGPINNDAETLIGKSIAYCMESVFGMGNSDFRISSKDKFVDTVPFPVYKKEVFSNIGVYDVRLIRNQDDDFHYRAHQAGYKIFMSQRLRVVCYVRENYSAFIKQFFQYGLFKPIVLLKNKRSVKIRHLVPSLFSLYVFFSCIIILTMPQYDMVLSLFIIYLFIDFYFSFNNNKSLIIKLLNLITFPLMHFSYGIGMLAGFKK